VDTLCACLKTDGVSLSNNLQDTVFWDVALCSLETGGCGSYFTPIMEAAGLGGVFGTNVHYVTSQKDLILLFTAMRT